MVVLQKCQHILQSRYQPKIYQEIALNEFASADWGRKLLFEISSHWLQFPHAALLKILLYKRRMRYFNLQPVYTDISLKQVR